MPDVTLRETVNVMVTPQFYTLKKEALPVKYAYQAKKIAPSLFDGLLEEDGNYEYMVSKEEEDWVFIAYDIKKITDFLALKGIKTNSKRKGYQNAKLSKQYDDIINKYKNLNEEEIRTKTIKILNNYSQD